MQSKKLAEAISKECGVTVRNAYHRINKSVKEKEVMKVTLPGSGAIVYCTPEYISKHASGGPEQRSVDAHRISAAFDKDFAMNHSKALVLGFISRGSIRYTSSGEHLIPVPR